MSIYKSLKFTFFRRLGEEMKKKEEEEEEESAGETLYVNVFVPSVSSARYVALHDLY